MNVFHCLMRLGHSGPARASPDPHFLPLAHWLVAAQRCIRLDHCCLIGLFLTAPHTADNNAYVMQQPSRAYAYVCACITTPYLGLPGDSGHVN